MHKLVLFSILLCTTSLHADNSWQLVRDKAGIQIFTRNVPGSVLKSFKGVMSIPASLSATVATIDDTSVYSQLFLNAKSSRVLKKVSDLESYKYIVTKLPWPAKSRDSIVHSILKQDKKSKVVQISMRAAPKYIPIKPGLVRIAKMSGRWLLIPQKGNVKVVYEMNIDPGGRLPAWLVNSMSVDMPFVTLSNLRNLVKRAKYQKVKLFD